MIAGIYNITCEQGSTFTRTFTIQNPDESAYDLTGYSARMQIRRDYDSTDTIFSATTANGHVSLNPVFGEITVDISAAETAQFSRGGVYDLEIYNSSGVVYKVVRGRFVLAREVTR